MTKKHRQASRQNGSGDAPRPPEGGRLTFTIVAGVALLVVAVLLLKGQATTATALPEAQGQAETTTTLGQPAAAPAPAEAELPEAQLERLLAAGQPAFAFFHSNNCVQCTKMIAAVQEVYPEFSGSVALLDVNVYDRRNASLLQRARIRAIPTQIFFNRAGEGRVVIGAMDPQQLRQQLQALAEGK